MTDKDYLKLAIAQAKKSVKQDGFPAGAIIVKDGKIISKGISVGFLSNDPTAHAEAAAIKEACRILKKMDLGGATLYESLACCMMCFSLASWSGILRIVYAARKTPDLVSKGFYEGATTAEEVNEQNNKKIELIFIPDFEKEVLEDISKWEKQNV